MTDTVITVCGHATERVKPEHALVTVTVSLDGAERASVFAQATATAETLQAELTALHAPEGPVTRWDAERIRVWSQRPWNDQGRQLDPVYHAQLGISATFVDTESLAAWVERAATTDGVEVGGIAWGLSDEREKAVLAEVRAAAVTDALDRARAFATSLGLTELQPLALADPGMLGDPGSPRAGLEAMAAPMFARDAAGGGELSFTPRPIELSVSVDARFAAR